MSIYLTQAEAEQAVSKIIWCWSDDNGVYVSADLMIDLNSIEAEVVSFLSVRYQLPITEANALQQLKGYLITLLRVRGYSRHPTAETPESVLQEGRQTRGALRDISSGAQLLGDAAQRTTGVRATSMGGTAGITDEPQFTRAKLGAWG